MDSDRLTIDCGGGRFRYSTLFMHFAFVGVSFYRSLVLLGSHGLVIDCSGGRFRYSMLLLRFRFIQDGSRECCQLVYTLQHYA